ncbi:MAG: chromosome segregation protein SMC, partial [Eubacterium sp.]|nr:chromosome segregation protein SMC [Eubacterium sp.]
MYLKSIEMQGFKSFAGKTRLEFHDGITGIVGPNGSGKSNVGDAMRWVLGEQSAKSLRGGNMQDVIFAGTQNRRPLGFASVAITLDNSDRKLNFDADEVTVTRKLFRSGESEYLMNGRSCRLRDINELFYDTGIGKEGYSIIGQGQIEKVLSGKPEDRRELFDEAAGIVKFKRRKIASLKKLSEEQSNLVRVNDILSELTRQLGPLESQAAKAEEYLKKRDTLRNLDICMFREEAGRTRKRLAEITEKKTIAQAQLSEIAEAFEKTRMEYEQVEKELEELDSEIARARDESQKAALLKKQAEGQVDVLREQIHTAETNSELYRNRMAAVEGEYDSRKAALDAQKEERDELKASLRIAASDKEKKEADVTRVKAEIDEKNEAVENSRSRTIELLNNRSSIKEKRQRYDTMLEQIDIRKAELSSRMLQLTEMRNAEKEKLEALKKDLQEVDNAAETQKAKVAGTEGRIGALKEEIDRQNKQLEIGQTAYHREASRLESLRNIAERYEGYGNSVKRIMEQKDNNPGIHGVIADLIKTQKKYETAIETALGGALQNIVTDNESTAKYLIEYLKRGHYGRATFLPLTAMKNDQSLNDQKILSETGVLGRADSLVSCDPLYKSVAARLLGRTIVVDTIDHAIAVSRRYHQSVRMVTLEGDLLSPGGSMTGGSFKYNSNLLGRKRQIEELDSSVRALKKDMQEMQASVEKNRAERNELRGRLAAETEELQKLYIRQNTVRLNAKAGQDRFDTIEADYNRLMKERAEIDRQIGDIRDMKDSIDRELVTSESEEKDLQQQIRELSGASEDLKARETKALEEQD